MGFKVLGVNTYDEKANLAQWLTLYEIAMRAAGGDEDVMASFEATGAWKRVAKARREQLALHIVSEAIGTRT